MDQADKATVPKGNPATSMYLNPILTVVELFNNRSCQVPASWARTSLILNQDDIANIQRSKFFRMLVVAIYHMTVEASGAHFPHNPETFPLRPA